MNNCLFCKIAKKEIKSNIVYEDQKLIAFSDINPQAPVHILIIPKEHISTLNDLNDENKKVIGEIYLLAKRLAGENDIDESGYRIVSNCNKDAGQSVFHVHWHLLGGRTFSWPPG